LLQSPAPTSQDVQSQVNADRQQQEQLQEKNEASTQQMEQQMRQSPGSVTQQQIDNKVKLEQPSLLYESPVIWHLYMQCSSL